MQRFLPIEMKVRTVTNCHSSFRKYEKYLRSSNMRNVEKFQPWKLFFVCAWVTRFIKNTRKGEPIHKTNVNQRDRVPN